MAIQIEAKGLTEDEVRDAIESALRTKGMPAQDRKQRLAELFIKACGHMFENDREFGVALCRNIRGKFPDITDEEIKV